jgi:hypothetical protein
MIDTNNTYFFQRALADLQQLRIEMERRLQEKEEELENLRKFDLCFVQRYLKIRDYTHFKASRSYNQFTLGKNMQFEIDRLTAALADAEARMKAEISRLKKKYQAEIAELEMTVCHNFH